jgi:3-oxoacyl-[acyl-carrier-protein] synthase II
MSDTKPGDVVITGIGVMSPIGTNLEAFWNSISAGQCGFRRSEHVALQGTPEGIGGEVSDFTEETAKKNHLKTVRKQIKVMCREIQMGVAAALQALEDAGLQAGAIAPERIGVEFGANLMSSPPEVMVDAARASSSEDGQFDYTRWGLHDGNRFQGMEPLWLLKYLPNMPGCHIGIAVDARGPNNSLVQDEASGCLAVAEAVGAIRRGRADVMITGTTGTKLTAVKSAQHNHWDVLASGPAETRCKPLDRNRSGEVIAEAACSLVLESRAHAEARGAKIYGSILGTGSCCLLDDELGEQPAIEKAIQIALKNAGLSVADLGHINSGASGNPKRDAYEAKALQAALGEHVSRIPVTAPKSYLGSAGAGSSLTELAVSLVALQHGVVPRTLNFQASDEDTTLNVVADQHQPTENRILLKTSVTRMGQCSVVIVGP